MKTKVTIVAACAIALCTGLSFTSCKKAEKGEIGPQGPAGTNGTNGNANVKAMTYTVTATNWTPSGSGGIQSAVITDADITQDIMNKGAIMVYLVNGSQTAALPLTMYPSSSYAINMQYAAAVGSLTISVQRSDQVAATNPGILVYKIVKVAASARMQNPDVNLKNYAEVKETFHFKD